MTERLPVSAIHVGDRHRRDMGNIAALAHSIDEFGLLHPIVVQPDGTLIAGARRLEAVKLLGWDAVQVTACDVESITRGEAVENFARKNFTPSEISDIDTDLRVEIERRAQERQEASRFGADGAGKLPPPEMGRSRDQIADLLGTSGRTLAKIRELAAARDEHPDLCRKMEETGKVSWAHSELVERRHQEEMSEVPPPDGRFRTILADPPWKYAMNGPRGAAAQYACMEPEDIAALPVPDWADDNAHLYLWATNAHMGQAHDVARAWGFVPKTILTWRKTGAPGLGLYFRGQTEHVVFCVRGSLRTRRSDIGTIFEAPRRRHSEKPAKLYEIVEEASPGPYLELFARGSRETWGAEAPTAEKGRGAAVAVPQNAGAST